MTRFAWHMTQIFCVQGEKYLNWSVKSMLLIGKTREFMR